MVERIKKLCSDNKTSIKALERMLEFGNGTIRRWDTNKPSVEKMVKVANFFNVPVAYLTGDVDDPNDRSLTHWGEIVYDQKEKPTTEVGSELNQDYSKLNGVNKAIVDSMIAQLLAAQSED